ncbi:MAG: hypothetical protein ACOYYJ_02725 [Chloroflexota bacterium]
MQKKWWFFAVGLLVVLIVLSLLLYRRLLLRLGGQRELSDLPQEVAIKEYIKREEVPIIKRTLGEDRQGVMYEFRGKIAEELERRVDNLWQGEFVFDGQGEGNKIPVLVGSMDDKMLWGEYAQAGFGGDFSWREAKSSEVLAKKAMQTSHRTPSLAV